ncbi:MAG: hypothetical protein KY432_05140 [Acidobacteria bacterium]|nr:hypothetical protein [Acidobacteriota bacterium]
MKNHVTVLAALFIACGFMGLLVALALFFGLAGISWASGDFDAVIVLSTIATIVGGVVAITALPTFIAGLVLLRGNSWARIFAIIVCALNVFNIPFGTALAIYGFWVLTRPEVVRMFDGADPSVEMMEPAAP